MEESKNIIIKRVKKVQGGHHGGSWKIAMADFAIAMMAFFLLMWLLANTTKEQKIELEKFFTDPVGYMDKVGRLTAIDFGGSPSMLQNNNPSADSEMIEQTQMLNQDQPEQLAAGIKTNAEVLDALQSTLIQTVAESETLKQFKDQLSIEIAPDGLHIQIVDSKLRPMFDPGKDELKLYFAEILLQLAPVIAQVNNKISVSGHTDASNYSDRDHFSNWELSAQRANAARRMLVEGGLPEEHVAQVVGFASSQLFDPTRPTDAINRRIEIVVLNRPTQEEIDESTGDVNSLSPEQEARMKAGEQFLLDSKKPESKPYDSTDNPKPAERKRAESTAGDLNEGRNSIAPKTDVKPNEVFNSLESILSKPESPYVPPPEVR